MTNLDYTTGATGPLGKFCPYWPHEMNAAVAARFLSFRSARGFMMAVRRGEYPRPSATRGQKAEPVWYIQHLESFLQRRHGCAAAHDSGESIDIAELIG